MFRALLKLKQLFIGQKVICVLFEHLCLKLVLFLPLLVNKLLGYLRGLQLTLANELVNWGMSKALLYDQIYLCGGFQLASGFVVVVKHGDEWEWALGVYCPGLFSWVLIYNRFWPFDPGSYRVFILAFRLKEHRLNFRFLSVFCPQPVFLFKDLLCQCGFLILSILSLRRE